MSVVRRPGDGLVFRVSALEYTERRKLLGEGSVWPASQLDGIRQTVSTDGSLSKVYGDELSIQGFNSSKTHQNNSATTR